MKRALCAAVLAAAAFAPAAHAGQPLPVTVVVWTDSSRVGAGTTLFGQPGLVVYVKPDTGQVCAGFGDGIPLCTPVVS
jgi:hypothetical protein